MKNILYSVLVFFVVFLSSCQAKKPEIDGILIPHPFNKVKLQDEFWLPRLKTQAEVLVPFAMDKTKPAVENLRRTASFNKGIDDELPFPHRFVSSDLYKVMEGVAYVLMIEPNPDLERKMDSIVDIIGDAQLEDGYLYVAHITGVAKGKGKQLRMGERPYDDVLHGHELYNIGHMYEAAVAYYQATGKRKWLDIAEKSAQHVNRVFFEGDPNYNDGKPVNQAPGHEEIELGLIKLYRATGNELYLEMSKKFLDIRGVTYKPDGDAGVMTNEYGQQHLPVRDQRKAVGHAVRAGYLYAAMAENAALHEDITFREALDSIWHNIVDTKMHIIGGLGAVHGTEGFGLEYVLPNKEAYDETCAAVANVLFNYRMFLMTRDAKYMDVAEVSLYNNALAGVNLDGNKFFYSNKLEVDWTRSVNRSPWFGTACCPSNIARLMPQVSGYMYTYNQDEIYTALYASSSTSIPFRDGSVSINQRSGYPFEGEVSMEIDIDGVDDKFFTVKLRIPTWARSDKFVPGELYTATKDPEENWQIKINGKKYRARLELGFALIKRKWKSGDVIELFLPMDVRFSRALEQVEADRNRIAVSRGPLVYCAEGVDQKGTVQAFYLPDVPADSEIVINALEGKLAGIPQIGIPAKRYTEEGFVDDQLKMVPYYSWNNRPDGDGSMIVWLPEQEDIIDKDLALGFRAPGGIKGIVASNTYGRDNVLAVIDGNEPKNSFDRSIPRWTNYPRRGEKDFVEIDFEEARSVRSVSVYWYDDKGGVQLPKSWFLEGGSGTKWEEIEIYNTDSYSILPDQYNLVHPAESKKYDKIRINVEGQKESAVGILECQIEFE